MDIISLNEAATANGRIEIINANPDSTSGVVTVPKVIASGESVTIPVGRVAVLPNVQVDGELNIEGEVFIPSGATFADLESQIALKANINSPTFTGTPTAPTPASGDNSTKVATTAYVDGKVGDKIVLGTAVSAGGTSVDFTNLPSWVKKVTITFVDVSLTSTADYLIQLGTASSIVSSGYSSLCITANASAAAAGANNTTGFVWQSNSGSNIERGKMELIKHSGNTWIATMLGSPQLSGARFGAGNITLSAALTRARITNTGSNTFDGGTINIMYEG